MSSLFANLWIEKYRPTSIADIVVPDRVRQEILKFKEQKEIPHLLFLSGPGQGKTTLAKIIVNEILDCSYLYINASDENGIDTIRTKIMGFATTKSLDGKLKVIILDEADGLTAIAQQALRNIMEEYSGNVRFILTANYQYKVIAPIQSRCQSINLSPPLDGVAKRVVEILKLEKIGVDADQRKNLLQLIHNNYPDVRKIINLISKNVIDGKLDIQLQNNGLDFANVLLKMVTDKEDVVSIRRHVIENDMQYNKDYHALLKDVFNAVDANTDIETLKKRKYMIVLAEHMYRHTFVMDPEINCYSAFIHLSEV